MDDKKVPGDKSKTGATITLATQTEFASSAQRLGECRPEGALGLLVDCAPDYHCAPDDASPEDALREGLAAQECEGYACCPEKAEYECEPNF